MLFKDIVHDMCVAKLNGVPEREIEKMLVWFLEADQTRHVNLPLARRQNLDTLTILTIDQIHCRLKQILTRPLHFVGDEKQAVDLVESLEYTLQMLWGFPIDKKYHKYWHLIKGCTCPNMDNAELVGSGRRIIEENCKFHGRGCD